MLYGRRGIEASSWEIQAQSAPVFEDAWTALVGILPVVGMSLVACWLSLAVGFRWRNLDELTRARLEHARPGQSHASKPVAWRLVDLFLLVAGCAVLLQVLGPYAATARDELQILYDNEVFSQFLQPISMTALLTTACAYCGLAKSRWIFWLGGLVAAVYEELRKLAAARLANERPGQTLQATAVVHEAFFAAAAEAMRRGF